MTVMDPDGSLDTWYLNQGDMFHPAGLPPHHIEVVDAPDLHFAIFFDQPTPGISAIALDQRVLREVPGCDVQRPHRRPARLPVPAPPPPPPAHQPDPLIVGRVNPWTPGYKALDTCLTSSFEARG